MDVLVRGLDAEIVKRLDEAAAATGVSRNAYVVGILSEQARAARPMATSDGFREAAELAADLGDAELMRSAWQ